MFETFYEQQKRRDHLIKSFTNSAIEPAANLTSEGAGHSGEDMGGQGMDKAKKSFKKGLLINGKFKMIKRGCGTKIKKGAADSGEKEQSLFKYAASAQDQTKKSVTSGIIN